jgi:bifunctional N-acetylglucosamine-1-phosphate-uridyltransferase/glucosamine-1-phosphate-acetyltransferase GlmU-like protein
LPDGDGARAAQNLRRHRASGRNVKTAVLEELNENFAEFVWQTEQLGTGHAVNAAREFLENEDSTLLVLSGDVPMIRAETLAALVQQHPHIAAKARLARF